MELVVSLGFGKNCLGHGLRLRTLVEVRSVAGHSGIVGGFLLGEGRQIVD